MRDAFRHRMREQGVEIGALSHAVHRLGAFQNARQRAEESGRTFRVTEEIVDLGFALPLYPTMSREDQDLVISLVKATLAEVCS